MLLGVNPVEIQQIQFHLYVCTVCKGATQCNIDNNKTLSAYSSFHGRNAALIENNIKLKRAIE